MKVKTLIASALLLASSLWANESSDFKLNTIVSGDLDHGGYGGPTVHFSTIGDEVAVWTGGRGGWIINHRFVLGIGGYGLSNEPRIEKLPGDDIYLSGGYGGAYLEYIFNPASVVHFSVGTLVGAGGFMFHKGSYMDDWDDWDHCGNCDDEKDVDNVQSGAAFVVNPWASIDINVLSFMQIGIEAGYLFYRGPWYKDIKENDIGGPSAGLMLKFGKF